MTGLRCLNTHFFTHPTIKGMNNNKYKAGLKHENVFVVEGQYLTQLRPVQFLRRLVETYDAIFRVETKAE
jgi:hypothetical protein